MTVARVLLAGLLASTLQWGQTTPGTPSAGPALRWPSLTGGGLRDAYRVSPVAPAQLRNSARLDQLLSGGKLRLSLQDAIALGLENNLDLELERFSPSLADSDLLRAEAGGVPRGIPLSIREGPAGLGPPQVGAGGRLGGGDAPALNTLTGPGVQTDVSILGSVPLLTGPAVPSLDPFLVGQASWDHRSEPQNSLFLPNIQSLNSRTWVADFGFQQGFATGGFVDAGWDNQRQRINSPLLNYNPAYNASLGVSFTQPLLRGFGFAVNRRYIRIASNNRQVASLVLEQQVIATVESIVRLYWDLVSLKEDVRVRAEGVASADVLLRDSQNQVEAGTAAPIDLTSAQAEVARRRRDLAVAQSLVRQQELVLKDYLTRSQLDTALVEAEVELTDTISLPAVEPVEPVNDLVETALRRRPDVAQARVQLENSAAALQGSRNGLLPALDLVARARNNGLVGQPAELGGLPGFGSGLLGGRTVDPLLAGGYGSALSQLFSRNFPDYGVGARLSIPILNRAARADVARDQIAVRQQEIRMRQIEKAVRLDILTALVAVSQARSTYDATRRERQLQEEAWQAERERLEVGASTTFNVIQYQRDLAAARSSEVSALGSYWKAKAALQRARGTLLEENGVVLDEALQGTVAKPASVP